MLNDVGCDDVRLDQSSWVTFSLVSDSNQTQEIELLHNNIIEIFRIVSS